MATTWIFKLTANAAGVTLSGTLMTIPVTERAANEARIRQFITRCPGSKWPPWWPGS